MLHIFVLFGIALVDFGVDMINWLILILTLQGHSCLNGRGLTPLDSASFDKVCKLTTYSGTVLVSYVGIFRSCI